MAALQWRQPSPPAGAADGGGALFLAVSPSPLPRSISPVLERSPLPCSLFLCGPSFPFSLSLSQTLPAVLPGPRAHCPSWLCQAASLARAAVPSQAATPPSPRRPQIWFQQMLPLASQGFRCIALDYPPVDTVDEFVAVFLKLLAELNLKYVRLVWATGRPGGGRTGTGRKTLRVWLRQRRTAQRSTASPHSPVPSLDPPLRRVARRVPRAKVCRGNPQGEARSLPGPHQRLYRHERVYQHARAPGVRGPLGILMPRRAVQPSPYTQTYSRVCPTPLLPKAALYATVYAQAAHLVELSHTVARGRHCRRGRLYAGAGVSSLRTTCSHCCPPCWVRAPHVVHLQPLPPPALSSTSSPDQSSCRGSFSTCARPTSSPRKYPCRTFRCVAWTPGPQAPARAPPS